MKEIIKKYLAIDYTHEKHTHPAGTEVLVIEQGFTESYCGIGYHRIKVPNSILLNLPLIIKKEKEESVNNQTELF